MDSFQWRMEISFEEITNFTKFLENEKIVKFLEADSCHRYSDKYLLATTLIYASRTKRNPLTIDDFYCLLYLANDMEEDIEFKNEILPWCLGSDWEKRWREFNLRKEHLWKKMGYRALVPLELLEEIIFYGEFCQQSWVWKRVRHNDHGGAIRDHHRPKCENIISPRGPRRSPMGCHYPKHSSELKRTSISASSGYFTDSSDEKGGKGGIFGDISILSEDYNEEKL
ncbi:Oidioi.mRNA.OKI2018_I69.chr1.g765.t1.cds [Oikopleura dioica]|uniref:Oidioi.mRNA.OKI2018_I69.chr1.g765.t1.cds n=1 Tax=Oikopleura dioica TaxID=34765 RepID=A0ABN7SKU8_OIKDI|nr:Oidioi.mRNA.OKI2018_I69.chr1.g765.t1.cds [Oikopleura dioica]